MNGHTARAVFVLSTFLLLIFLHGTYGLSIADAQTASQTSARPSGGGLSIDISLNDRLVKLSELGPFAERSLLAYSRCLMGEQFDKTILEKYPPDEVKQLEDGATRYGYQWLTGGGSVGPGGPSHGEPTYGFQSPMNNVDISPDGYCLRASVSPVAVPPGYPTFLAPRLGSYGTALKNFRDSSDEREPVRLPGPNNYLEGMTTLIYPAEGLALTVALPPDDKDVSYSFRLPDSKRDNAPVFYLFAFPAGTTFQDADEFYNMFDPRFQDNRILLPMGEDGG